MFHYFFLVLATIIVFWSTDTEALMGLTVWHFLGITVLGFVMSMGFAMLVGRFIERPMQNKLRNFLAVKNSANRPD